MRRFAGTAWISESDSELVRLQVEALETVSVKNDSTYRQTVPQ